MQLGVIGLGKMGSRMARKLLENGHDVVVWNRTEEKISNFKFQISNLGIDKKKLQIAVDIASLINSLQAPKIVWVMLPAGEATEAALQEVAKHVDAGDTIINGANGHYTDAQKQSELLAKKGVKFLDIGVSGGVIAAENGYPMMVGGDKSAYEHITPILDSLALPHGGHAYFGPAGAGHFVKMVHNGVEYGQMQAIGEGFGVLEKAPYPLDLLEVARLWQKGTIVSSFLIDRATDALEKDPQLEQLDGVIDATGEALWTVEQAKKEQVPVDVIEKSLEFRTRSKSEKAVSNSFAARMVAALRREFGGHKVKEK